MYVVVVVVVCRGMLCLVLCVVYGVVYGCIICVVFRGILYWVLCVVDYSLACALEFFLSRALQRVFSLCLFVRKASGKSLRVLTSGFSLSEASLFGWFFCVFCRGFFHDI